MQLDFLINNTRLHDRDGLWQIGIVRDRFAYVGQSFCGAARHTVEAQGHLLLPGLMEPHTHIDKTYTWQQDNNLGKADTEALLQAIAAMKTIKAERSLASVRLAAKRALDRALRFGVSHLRTHIDIGCAKDLEAARVLIALRDQYSSKIKVELTALGSTETKEQRSLLLQALDAGLDCVGGAPALTGNPVLSVQNALMLAEEYQKPLDLHIDENENPSSPCLETLAELILERNFKYPVMASHCCSLAFAPKRIRTRVLKKVHAAGIHLVALPACNLLLMARHKYPQPRGTLPVREALNTGINVCAGSDNVGDPFQPWGDYDPLNTAELSAETAQLDNPAQAFALITSAPAKAFGLKDYGIASGNIANCALVDAVGLRAAISESPLRTHVFFAGRLILQQQLQQIWS